MQVHTKIHRKMTSERRRKRESNKRSKESSGKDGGKDAAVGVGMFQGEWVCPAAAHKPEELNHTKTDRGERVRLATGPGSKDLNNFKKVYNASPSTPSETTTNIPSDHDGQEFLNDWDEWTEHEVGNGPRAHWEDIHYVTMTSTLGRLSHLLLLHQRLLPQMTPMASLRSTTS